MWHAFVQPIVYVNDEFERSTLYSREEALGLNWRSVTRRRHSISSILFHWFPTCRFLLGNCSSPATISCIQQAISARDAVEADVGGEALCIRVSLLSSWIDYQLLMELIVGRSYFCIERTENLCTAILFFSLLLLLHRPRPQSPLYFRYHKKAQY